MYRWRHWPGLRNSAPIIFPVHSGSRSAMPPHRYHINRRIERAKCLLANFSLSVTEIGLRLGFSESSAFAATFRKVAGRTPSDFRRTLE